MSIEQVDHTELRDVIKESYRVKIPLFIHGTFGIGKTDSVKAAAQEIVKDLNSDIPTDSKEKTKLEFSDNFEDTNQKNYFMVRTIPAHHLDAGDLKGLPFPDKEHKKTTFLQTDYLPEDGHGIMFFDELNLAPPMIQANLYQIILDRRLGKYKVPDNYTCIAAGNMEDDRSHAFSMALPLKNRFIHVQLRVPTVADWIDNYALPNGVDHRIMTFLKWQEQYLHQFDGAKVSKNGLADEDLTAIATPRTWVFLSKLIKSTLPDSIEKADGFSYKKLNRLANATVGLEVGNAFVAWLKMSINYDISKIYETGKIDKKPTAIDQLYSLSSALLSFYLKVPENNTALKAKTAVSYAKLAMEFFPTEHATMMLSQAKYIDKEWLGHLKKDATLYKSIVKSLTKYLI